MEFDKIIEEINQNMHKNYNGMYLSDKQISILNQYHFDYRDYHSIEELIFDVDTYLNENYVEDLDLVLEEISEYHYYHNTNQ